MDDEVFQGLEAVRLQANDLDLYLTGTRGNPNDHDVAFTLHSGI